MREILRATLALLALAALTAQAGAAEYMEKTERQKARAFSPGVDHRRRPCGLARGTDRTA